MRYLQQNNFTWREDISNKSNKYLRNRIRHELIPLLHDMNDDCPSSKGTNVRKRTYNSKHRTFEMTCANYELHKTTLPRTPSIDRSYSYTTKDITISIINGIDISRYTAPVPLIGVGTTCMSITIIPRIKIVFVPPQGQVFVRSPQLTPAANSISRYDLS